VSHIVLLGDSILDNRAYTEGGPDVVSQVQELLPQGSHATLLAVDGSTTVDISSQVQRIPSDATHLVLSVGGNDAILNSDVLLKPLDSPATALGKLADVSQEFEEKYRRAVVACRETGFPLTICTIYNGNFPDRKYQRLASSALLVFNDAILRVGFEFGLTVIDLRFVCASPEDYANPIEPSSKGGAKIARCIVRSMEQSGSPGARVVID
jgi:GDSL-like lipase/acylhydrolase family protein